MKKTRYGARFRAAIISTFILTVALTSCTVRTATGDAPQGKILQSGAMTCFAAGTMNDKKDNFLHCEASAVVYYDGEIVFAMDKPAPVSPVFRVAYSNESGVGATVEALETSVFNTVQKIEDLSISPDGALIVAVSGFDRFDPEKPKWDAYSSLIYWEKGKSSKPKIAHETVNKAGKDSYKSSVQLRKSIAAAFEADNLEVPSYYKIEGVALLPNNKIFFGIREIGKSYEDFKYQIKLISADYTYEKTELKLNNFRIAYDFDPSEVQGITQPLGLSSIEYDRYHDRIFLLTSYEKESTDEGIGAYLWVLPLEDLKAKNAPKLVMKTKNEPLHFAHKSEGVTVIDQQTVLIINDDDRVTGRENVKNSETQFSRKPEEATYYVVKIKG